MTVRPVCVSVSAVKDDHPWTVQRPDPSAGLWLL